MTRIQFNIRLDKHPDLHKAIRSKVEEEGICLNDFAIDALKAAMGWEVEESSFPRKVEAIEERLASLEERLAAVVNLEERLAALEKQRGKLQKSA